MARIALVATVEMAGLNECLDHITPEWLQSLILDQGSVSAAYGVAARVRDDPERCLGLLQVCRLGAYVFVGWLNNTHMERDNCFIPTPHFMQSHNNMYSYKCHINCTFFREPEWGREIGKRDRKLRKP